MKHQAGGIVAAVDKAECEVLFGRTSQIHNASFTGAILHDAVAGSTTE
jgi:hypothetical protein